MRVCLDFDGVVHSYTSPWIDALTIPDPIVPDVIEFISDCIDAGITVAIHSSRSHTLGAIEAMKEWLENEMMPYMARECAESIVSQIEFPEHKPPAQIYIDDRGYHFNGKFPRIEWIKAFKPWNRM